MHTKGLSVKNVVAIGIGSAIYVILARFTSIPTPIPNTNIELVFPFWLFLRQSMALRSVLLSALLDMLCLISLCTGRLGGAGY